MKNKLFYLLMLFAAITFGFSLTACSDDDDNGEPQTQEPPEIPELEREFFSVEDAAYHDESIPTGWWWNADDHAVQVTNYNSASLSGGCNIVTVCSDKPYNRIFIAVEGVNGYWEWKPQTQEEPATTRLKDVEGYRYDIPLYLSTNLSRGFTLVVSAEDEDGHITTPFKAPINHISSEPGDVSIILSFFADKDMDLHLYTPSGNHIYYGNRGGYYTNTDGEFVYCGLDHESWPGCQSTETREENIVIPAFMVEKGTYKVVVNLYSNCDTDVPALWNVTTRYMGEIITPVSGANPARGTYEATASEDDNTEVMTFSIDEGIEPSHAPQTFRQSVWRPAKLSVEEESKVLEYRWSHQ